MIANELRIGNMFSIPTQKIIDTEILGINTSTNSVINHNKEWVDISALEPIPLTEEWLLKFGFNKELRDDYKNEQVDTFYFYGWGGIFYQNEKWNPTQYYFAEAFGEKFELKFVHQLQNLYFALTGEELKTK